MTKALKEELCLYLGELNHKWETSNNPFVDSKIIEKINAINLLLDIDIKHKKWWEKIQIKKDSNE